MAIIEVKVPQLSESVAEATLLQWKKKAGEAVHSSRTTGRPGPGSPGRREAAEARGPG